MKVAVLSFSGNVGKSTIARHLLAPRLPGATVISIESINAGEELDHVIRGRQFAELQEFLQIVDDVVVDIGASNVEDLLALMKRYQGSHEDFDVFIVPTVSAVKQQRDTMATLVELSRLGISPKKVRVLFNMVEEDSELERQFEPLLAFLRQSPIATVSSACRLGFNEIYGRLSSTGTDLSALATDPTDYKECIKLSADKESRLANAQSLAIQRLARGVLPELDACFRALNLSDRAPSNEAV